MSVELEQIRNFRRVSERLATSGQPSERQIGSIASSGFKTLINLSLPTSDQVFSLPAIVRWAAAGEGMGIQFVGVDVDVLLELNDYFGSL